MTSASAPTVRQTAWMTEAAASSDWAARRFTARAGQRHRCGRCGSPVAPACAVASPDGTSSSIRTVCRPVRTRRLRRSTSKRARHLFGCPGRCDEASMTRTWRVLGSRGVVRRPRRCCVLRSTAGCGRRPRPRPTKRPSQTSCAVSARRRKPCFDGAATPELQVPVAPVGLCGSVPPGCRPASCARSRLGAASRPLRVPRAWASPVPVDASPNCRWHAGRCCSHRPDTRRSRRCHCQTGRPGVR